MVLYGAISTPLRWQQFDRAWAKALRKHDFPYAHAKEILHREGPFNGVEQSRLYNFTKKLDRAIQTHVAAAFCTLLNRHDFLDYRGSDKQLQTMLDSDFGVSFRACLGFLQYHVPILFPDKTHEIYVEIEEGHTNAGSAVEIHKKAKAELGSAYLVKHVGFVDWTCFGAQGCDIHASAALSEEKRAVAAGEQHFVEFNAKKDVEAVRAFAAERQCPVFRLPVAKEDMQKLKDKLILSKPKFMRQYSQHLSATALASQGSSRVVEGA